MALRAISALQRRSVQGTYIADQLGGELTDGFLSRAIGSRSEDDFCENDDMHQLCYVQLVEFYRAFRLYEDSKWQKVRDQLLGRSLIEGKEQVSFQEVLFSAMALSKDGFANEYQGLRGLRELENFWMAVEQSRGDRLGLDFFRNNECVRSSYVDREGVEFNRFIVDAFSLEPSTFAGNWGWHGNRGVLYTLWAMCNLGHDYRWHGFPFSVEMHGNTPHINGELIPLHRPNPRSRVSASRELVQSAHRIRG